MGKTDMTQQKKTEDQGTVASAMEVLTEQIDTHRREGRNSLSHRPD